MYIARKNDGQLEIIRNLDEKKPDPKQLRNVEEIYVVGKVLVPVLSLEPKPRQERDQIMRSRKLAKPVADHAGGGKVSELKRKTK